MVPTAGVIVIAIQTRTLEKVICIGMVGDVVEGSQESCFNWADQKTAEPFP